MAIDYRAAAQVAVNATNETGRLFAFRPTDDTAYRVPVVLDGQYYGMAAR